MPRVQLIRGLARTMVEADLSADGRSRMPQVSSTVGRHSGDELIPSALLIDPSTVMPVPGLDPGIRHGHPRLQTALLWPVEVVDGRTKSGHDGEGSEPVIAKGGWHQCVGHACGRAQIT